MRATTYKALDNTEAGLKAGHVYDVDVLGRFAQFTDRAPNGPTISLYKHEVERALGKGELVPYDDTQSDAMHAKVVGKLCHSLATRYIY